MYNIAKKQMSKVLAGLLAVIMMLSLIPVGLYVTAFAAGVDQYSVMVVDEKNQAITDGITITLTNKADSSKKQTEISENGVAIFKNFVEEDATYIVSVDPAVGYEDVADYELSVAEGDSETTLQLTALEKVTLSGTVVDETGAAYVGAKVVLTGYLSAEVVTTDGTYSFEVFKGKDYSLTATAKEDKYNTASTTIAAIANDRTCTLKFTVKEFNINTAADENGTITSAETVSYGDSRKITATANDGYCIDDFIVNGTSQSNAKGLKSFDYDISSVTENYNISVGFIRKTYKITFTVGENGDVTYDDGAQKVPGGSVSVDKVFNESTDPNSPTKVSVKAVPAANYRVSKIVADNASETFDENDKEYSKEFIMTSDHSFVVEFKLNTFNVTIDNEKNGTATVDKSKVDYDGTAIITIKPNDGFNIEAVTVDGVATTDYDIKDDDVSYQLTLANIKKDTVVRVSYSAITTIEKDNVSFNDTDAISVDDSNANIIKYVFAKDANVIFSTEKNRIRVNGNKSNTNTYSVSESTIVKKIEVRDGKNWYTVELAKDIQVIIDKKAPAITTDKSIFDWTNSDKVTISGSVTDENTSSKPSSGLNYVVWKKDGTLKPEQILAESVNKANISADGRFTFESETGEQDSIYYIYAVDISGNISAYATTQVRIDKKAPVITAFTFSTEENNVIQDAIKFLTFGIFCNEKMYVTVEAKDDDISSGLNEIELYTTDGEFSVKKEVTGKSATFELTGAVFKNGKELSAKINDVAGNDSTATPTDTNVSSNYVKITTDKPTVEFITSSAKYTQDGKLWYDGNTVVTVKVSDEESKAGIYSVSIKLNGVELEKDINNKDINALFYKNHTDAETFEINTSQNPVDGENTIEVSVTNNAGNVCDTFTKTVYKDVESPVITGFKFNAEDYKEGSETDTTVEVTDYGFYFTKDTSVTISAKDDGPSAGIKSITYYTVDIDSGKSEEITEPVNSNGEITFTVKASFKGQIYAKATDNVLNTATDFVNPNSAIVEDDEKHGKENHIEFAKEQAKNKTSNGGELYSKDVPVEITVTDTYSGIRSIEWSVQAPYDTDNDQSGSVTVANDRSMTGDGNWTQTRTEANLVYVMKKTIIVNNNSNDIVVNVKMTDRAGNTSEEKIIFSIDKTAPVIEVTYDNNTPDETYTDFFKADRKATIKITERNFNKNDVVYKITNTDGTIPSFSDWTEHKDTVNPDATYYTAEILYHADGDYTFDISYADLAKNKAADFAQHKFTIDQTMPTVSVAYDNMSALNGNYYKADRVATITIVEHNFDAARVTVIGTATDNGATVAFPVTSAWNDNGDTHTATIHYASDAKYSFDIEFNDKAGNSIADYTPEEFYVDKTAPTLEISGVADKSANNGTVAPVITFTDTNYNGNAISYTLTGVSNGKVNYSSSISDIANGQRVTFADFEKIQKVDDIYILTATLTDMAGNETTKSITFSANRFGSVYDLATLEKIIGKYLQNEEDVVFTETNVDSLKKGETKIKLTKNGTPKDLVEGTDYTVTETGGNGQWSQYKYTINKALFTDDGRYSISVYSVDAAGNINENIDETKKAEISFGVDKTKPVIVPIDFESDTQYPVEVKTVSVEIKDNLVLEGVKIYLNGSEIKYNNDGETYTFDIPEKNEKQNVRIVAVDAAGNEYELLVENFLVSTNLFVRWFNNTPLFIGSIAGVVILCGAIVLLVMFKRRKSSK